MSNSMIPMTQLNSRGVRYAATIEDLDNVGKDQEDHELRRPAVQIPQK